MTSPVDVVEPVIPQNLVVEPRTPNGETWNVMKVSVVINLVELGFYVGEEWRSPLATVQVKFCILHLFVTQCVVLFY